MDPNVYLEDLRIHMRKMKPVPAAHHCRQKIFCYKDLYKCSHLFLRVDASKKSLDQLYSGSHLVVNRLDDRNFTVNINGKDTVVHVERLKPAHLASTEVFENPNQLTTSMSNPDSNLSSSTSTQVPDKKTET